LVGDGPQNAELKDWASQSKRKVIFPGWVSYSRLIELYAISDLFVHPGLREPWGCSVQEAAVCRLPIVASDLVGASHDILQHNVNGLIYDGLDEKALIVAISTMLAKIGSWKQMGEQSYLIAQDWGHDKVISELKKAVEYALTKSGTA
jgi:phosphatidylinositol alpha 1,6-mannosyltransferase